MRKKTANKFTFFLTVLHSKGHIQTHIFRVLWISQTYEYFTLSAWDLPALTRLLSLSEICVWFCTRTNTARLPLALLSLVFQRYSSFDWKVFSKDGFKSLARWSCTHCQILGGRMGRKAKKHNSGFYKHSLVRWNGYAPRWPQNK